MIEQKMTYTLDQIDTVVDMLYAYMASCHIMTFTGPLGAGKTTIIRELLRRCGVKDIITSPTFTYVNLYTNEQGQALYHFDLYRIQSLDDFAHAGFDEYLYQPNSRCFIEWPAIIEPLLSAHVCRVTIDYDGPDARTIHVMLD